MSWQIKKKPTATKKKQTVQTKKKQKGNKCQKKKRVSCVFLFDQVSSCACWATCTKKSYLFAFCSPHCAQRNGLSGE